MSGSVIERYKEWKKKNLLEFSGILESIITLENNTLWTKRRDFDEISKSIIDVYVEKYYFDNNINRNNPIEYSNDKLNTVLLSIIDYYKNIGSFEYLNSKKNETFLLTIIICAASYLDIAANVVDGNYIKLKNKFKVLLRHLQKTGILKVYVNDRIQIKKLFEVVRENIAIEEKFFGYFEREDGYNTYKIISKEPILLEVDFNSKIDILQKYNSKLVDNINAKYTKEYFELKIELLSILLLKENLMNKTVNNYLVTIPNDLVKRVNLKVLNDDLYKSNIKLGVDLEYYWSDKEKIEELKKSGFEVVYICTIDKMTLLKDLYNITVIVDKEIDDSILIEDLKSHNVSYLVRNEEEVFFTDKEICELKENE